MDWTEIKVVWFQEPQQYFFGNWAKRAWTISLLSLGSINRLSEGTRETKRREGVGTAQRSLQFSVQVMALLSLLIWSANPIQFNAKNIVFVKELTWKQNETDGAKTIQTAQDPPLFNANSSFPKSCGKTSNSKNWLEDKMGQDEINCTGSHFSYSQTLSCHDFSSCQRGFLQFKLSQSTGQSSGLLFTSAISWKPYQRILPCFSSCPCFQFSL